jgi:hypothetical protein
VHSRQIPRVAPQISGDMHIQVLAKDIGSITEFAHVITKGSDG